MSDRLTLVRERQLRDLIEELESALWIIESCELRNEGQITVHGDPDQNVILKKWNPLWIEFKAMPDKSVTMRMTYITETIEKALTYLDDLHFQQMATSNQSRHR